jgi:hypothetical protein
MNRNDDKALRDLLQKAIPPAPDTVLRHDLWPQMLQRLDRRDSVYVPWFDWALAALASTALFFFPSAIPALLYHL